MLLVVHNDLILTLRNGHWRLHLARRGTRWLASGLICSIPLVIVALGRYGHGLGAVQRSINVTGASLRVRDHECLEVVRFGTLVSKAVVAGEAQLPIRLLSCNLSLH